MEFIWAKTIPQSLMINSERSIVNIFPIIENLNISLKNSHFYTSNLRKYLKFL